MRIVIYFCGVLFAFHVHADVPANVNVGYDQSGAIVDYSGLSRTKNITRIEVRNCIDGLATCAMNSPVEVPINEIQGFNLDTPGQSLVTFYSLLSGAPLSPTVFEGPIWNQAVTVFDKATPGLRSAIERHTPSLSFHEEELYAPLYIRDIASRPLSELDESLALTGSTDHYRRLLREGQVTGTYGDLVRGNGELRNRIFLEEEAARSLFGDKSDFPTYWYVEYDETGMHAWVTYFFSMGLMTKLRNILMEVQAALRPLEIMCLIGNP